MIKRRAKVLGVLVGESKGEELVGYPTWLPMSSCNYRLLLTEKRYFGYLKIYFASIKCCFRLSANLPQNVCKTHTFTHTCIHA